MKKLLLPIIITLSTAILFGCAAKTLSSGSGTSTEKTAYEVRKTIEENVENEPLFYLNAQNEDVIAVDKLLVANVKTKNVIDYRTMKGDEGNEDFTQRYKDELKSENDAENETNIAKQIEYIGEKADTKVTKMVFTEDYNNCLAAYSSNVTFTSKGTETTYNKQYSVKLIKVNNVWKIDAKHNELESKSDVNILGLEINIPDKNNATSNTDTSTVITKTNSDANKSDTTPKTFQVEGSKTIKIKGITSQIEINSVDGTEVVFKPDGDGLIAKENGDVISAEITSSNLIIDIPKNYSQALEVSTSSGDVIIKSFKLKSLALNSISGKFEVSDVSLDETNIETGSADVEFSGNPGTFYFKSVSGNLTGNFESIGNSTTTTTSSGDIAIKLPADANFAIDYASTSGDYNIDFKGNNSKRAAGSKSFNDKIGDGKNTIKVDSISGNLKLN